MVEKLTRHKVSWRYILRVALDKTTCIVLVDKLLNIAITRPQYSFAAVLIVVYDCTCKF